MVDAGNNFSLTIWTQNVVLVRFQSCPPVAGSLPDDVSVAVYLTENDNGG